jgi:hypothetical protein
MAVAVIGLAMPARAEDNSDGLLFPPNAKPGECYTRVFVPAAYKTTSETVLSKNAYEKIDVLPAQFGSEEKTVVAKEASERLEVIPATYEWVEERVMVKPASKKLVEVPAQFDTVTERVLESPAHTIWKKGRGPIEQVSNSTGEIMCLIEVPATYKTISKRVVTSPATTREVEIPAEYKTVRKQVMKTPPSTRVVKIPAEYQSIRIGTVVSPAQVKTTQVPAVYQTVTKTMKVADGRMEWRRILCETNTNPDTVRNIQTKLKNAHYYDGPIDGILGLKTLTGLHAFQKAKGLPEAGLSMESLEALGISRNR